MRGKLAYGVATVALTAAVAACGSSSDSSSTATPSKTANGSTATKDGGNVTVLMGTAPDFLDPAGGLHHPVGGGDVDLLPGAVHVRAQER